MDKTARTPSVKDEKKRCHGSYRLRTTGPARMSDPWRPQQPKEFRSVNAKAAGRPTRTGRPTIPRPRTTEPLRTTDTTPTEPNLRKSEKDRTTGDRTTERPWTSGTVATEAKLRTSEELRTSGPPRASGRPASPGRPGPGCVQLRAEAHVPLHFTPFALRL